MSRLWGTRTHENLLRAFSAEAQANRRQLWFARVAEAEGRPAAAARLRRVAEEETGHALALLDFLADVGDPATDLPIGTTALNLKAAIAAEARDCAASYADVARVARAEGFPAIAGWFEEAARAEELHAREFEGLLAGVD